MAYSALIPFLLLFVSFVFLRMTLVQASFIALLSSTLMTQVIFHANSLVWNVALTRTAEFLVEIGLILFGAFYFIKVARLTHVVDSLAGLVKEVSPHRIIQGILVTFPLELMVEGSSGFGTPLLIIAPILLALHFPIELCAVLPFINMVNGIPFGALGTPLRLGFPGLDALQMKQLSYQTSLYLMPLMALGPLTTFFLIQKYEAKKMLKAEALKVLFWILTLVLSYALIHLSISKTGPEFPALGAGFITFLIGVISARIFFPAESSSKGFKNKKGILVYGSLLIFMWVGTQIWMDQLITGTHIRIFNPGWVFLIMGTFLALIHPEKSAFTYFRMAISRSQNTLIVFACMTFIVQQMRQNGGLELLTSNLSSLLTTSGAPLLGWVGSIFIGTSTMTCLFLSKVVDPIYFAALSAGSAVGVQLGFQATTGMRSILHEKISEKEIFKLIAPISVGFILIVTFYLQLIHYL